MMGGGVEEDVGGMSGRWVGADGPPYLPRVEDHFLGVQKGKDRAE